LVLPIAIAAAPVKNEGLQDVPTLVKDMTEFAFSLYPTLDEGNLIFSPYAIATSLSMVYIGARGETETQMNQALHLSLNRKAIGKASFALTQSLLPQTNTKNSYQLNIESAVWVDQGVFLLSDFRYAIEQQFKAKLGMINFAETDQSLDAINDWISTQTQEKIPHLLDSQDINTQTRLVLTNAAYLQGTWASPFNPKLTIEAPFHPASGPSTTTEMMQQTSSFPYYENDMIQAIALPFIGGNLAFVVLLPKSPDNFIPMFDDLTHNWSDWLTSMASKRIALQMPKYTLNNRFDLRKPLEQLGMEDAFDSDANFVGIDGMRDLFLNKVVHEAYLSVDENGVVAAAAAAASTSAKGVPPNATTTMIVDHPFLFFIVDLKSQTMLFMGKIEELSQ
jgi:serpin B